MNVAIFGVTGMVGQGVVHECLADPRVESVLALTRSPSSIRHPKLTQVLHDDFADLTRLAHRFEDIDACFYCLGVSAVGVSESEYRLITFDFTVAAAQMFASRNPSITFVYVSAQGADNSGSGRSMWARVRGQTENTVLAIPLQAFILRPGYIQPRHGATSRTATYNWIYRLTAPLYPLLQRLLPTMVTNSENVGKAMLALAANGSSQRIIDCRGINELATAGQ
ncbi:NAD(P)H-binding protein [Rhodococcus wratislaviensis]|uniref:NAD(P)-binding domain-containing protein n=1 Tax=Rhodococcus wratislaviensis NBRC 100605 TaxID=1219028 RepID=X0QYE5_RHOWR|nr:NAD(P)H-binding protein [Rhodococcus wratislaviensis]GAF43635.1 hypothetical protein RW1_009_00590 [Rhodococcus wratislaviensis NBRC 100605]